MDWGSALGGIASAAGSIGDLLTGGYFSRKAWERQKEAMQNAHQWEVADLRAAGLNPILSANNGASTGGLNGSMVSDTGQVSRGVSNAIQAMLAKGTLEKQKAEIDNLHEDSSLKAAQRFAQQALARSYDYQAALNAESAYNLYRTNQFWDNNPDTFMVKQANDAVPGLGAATALLGGAFNSAKGLSHKYSDRTGFHNTHGLPVPVFVGGTGKGGK